MSGSSSSSLPLSTVFNGESYDFWSVKMKAFLMAHDLWDVIEQGYEQPDAEGNYTAAQVKQQKDPSMKNMKALSFLFTVVSEEIFPKIVAATTANEAQDKLEEEFKGSEKVRAVRLQALTREFENLRMKETEKVKDYTSRVEQ